jgi:hypothetical protein
MKNKDTFYAAADLPKTSSDVNNVLAGNIFQSTKPVRSTAHEARGDCKNNTPARFHDTVGFGPFEIFQIITPTVDVVHHLRAGNFSEQNIGATTFYIGADFLHDEQEIMQRFNKGRYKPERLQNGRYIDAKEILERRTIELVTLQHALEKTPARLREQIEVDNKTEKSWRMLYTHAEYRRQDSKPIDNIECKKLLDAMHKHLQRNLDAYASSQYCDIMATFDAQFDSIGDSVSPAERVAIAMSSTVGAIASKMPPACVAPLQELCTPENVKGLVNESAVEEIADTESRDAGTTDLYEPEYEDKDEKDDPEEEYERD